MYIMLYEGDWYIILRATGMRPLAHIVNCLNTILYKNTLITHLMSLEVNYGVTYCPTGYNGQS